jgi:hypothetical protein
MFRIYILSAIEIALLIILPLIKFYQQSKLTRKQYIINIALLYLIWYFSYAGLHELCHIFGSWITGTKILDYQLIPPFWKGDFKTAYVNPLFENNNQAVVSVIMPYLRDIVFLIIGFWLLIRKRINNHFLKGLILILFILSSLFDIINNYSGFVFVSFGDFKELSIRVGVLYANVIGLAFTLIATVITLRIFVLYKYHPDL